MFGRNIAGTFGSQLFKDTSYSAFLKCSSSVDLAFTMILPYYDSQFVICGISCLSHMSLMDVKWED